MGYVHRPRKKNSKKAPATVKTLRKKVAAVAHTKSLPAAKKKVTKVIHQAERLRTRIAKTIKKSNKPAIVKSHKAAGLGTFHKSATAKPAHHGKAPRSHSKGRPFERIIHRLRMLGKIRDVQSHDYRPVKKHHSKKKHSHKKHSKKRTTSQIVAALRASGKISLHGRQKRGRKKGSGKGKKHSHKPVRMFSRTFARIRKDLGVGVHRKRSHKPKRSVKKIIADLRAAKVVVGRQKRGRKSHSHKKSHKKSSHKAPRMFSRTFARIRKDLGVGVHRKRSHKPKRSIKKIIADLRKAKVISSRK